MASKLTDIVLCQGSMDCFMATLWIFSHLASHSKLLYEKESFIIGVFPFGYRVDGAYTGKKQARFQTGG